jgi:hypothetical protein
VVDDLTTHHLRVGYAPGLMEQEGAIARFGDVEGFSLLLLETRVMKRAQSLGISHVASAAGAGAGATRI